MTSREEPIDHGLRHSAFVAVTVAFLVFLYLFSPFTQLFLGWFVDFDSSISHRVHEVTFGALFAIIFVGVLAQLRAPTRNSAGLIQANAAALILSIVITVSTGWEWTTLLYLAPLAALVWLHPDRFDAIRYRLQPHRGMVALMALITFSFLDAFNSEFVKAANEVRGHQTHWGGMAALALTLLILGYLAAFRVQGWPIMARTTGFIVILYAAVSLRFRFDASARPGMTAIFAIIWGLAFLYTARRARPVPAVRRNQTPDAVESARRPAVEPRRPAVALVVAAGFAVVLNIVLGTSGSDAAGPTLVLALVLVGIVVTRWRRWRRASRSPAVLRPTRIGAMRRRLAPAGALAGFAGLLFVGAAGAEIAREITRPPVPHTVDPAGRSFATARSYCVACHATGEQQATKINPSRHPYEDRAGTCIECHSVPPVSAESTLGSPVAAPWSDYRPTRLRVNVSLARLDSVETDRVAALVREIDMVRSP